MNVDMDLILKVVLVVLVIAAIWAFVEIALTIRRARPTLDETKKAVEGIQATVNDVAEQAKPVIAHVDEAVSGAKPAVDGLQPLLEQATTAVTALQADLVRVDAILSDASRITGAASNATMAVNNVTSSLAGKIRGRLAGLAGQPSTRAIPEQGTTTDAQVDAEATQAQPAGAASEDELSPVTPDKPQVTRADKGYFTYPSEDAAALKAE